MLQGYNLVPMTLKLQHGPSTEILVQDKAETPFPERLLKNTLAQVKSLCVSFPTENVSVLEIRQSNFYKEWVIGVHII